MTESVKCIFEHNIKLLGELDQAVFYFREQQYEKAFDLIANSMDRINNVLEAIITDREYFNLVDTDSILEMLSGILEAKRSKDYIMVADLLELQLISFLIRIQELIISKEEIIFDEDNYQDNINLLLDRGIGFMEDMREPIDTAKLLESGYRVEFTSCGTMTLAAENMGSQFYFHTNSKAQTEAFLLARSWLQGGKKRYLLYGFGMGYHVNALSELSKESEIEVYEADRNVIQLACAFADIKEILKNHRIKLIYDPEFNFLKDRIDHMMSEETFIIHYPSYKNIRNSIGKNLINEKLLWPEEVNVNY